MSESLHKSKPSKKDSKSEEVAFWRAKKKIAYKNKKEAESTGNGGWIKMLQKRITKYNNKIKNLTENNKMTFEAYILSEAEQLLLPGLDGEKSAVEINTDKMIPWDSSVLKKIENIKKEIGKDIDFYNTSDTLTALGLKRKMSGSTNVGNGAIYVAIHYALQNGMDPALDFIKFVDEHVEVNGVDVKFTDANIEVKDITEKETGTFRAGAARKPMAAAIDLLSPFNNALGVFISGFTEWKKDKGNKFDDALAALQEQKTITTSSWGKKNSAFFLGNAFDNIVKEIQNEIDKQQKTADQNIRGDFFDNLINKIAEFEKNPNIKTPGDVFYALKDELSNYSKSNFVQIYGEISSEIKKLATQINENLKTLAASILDLDKNNALYLTSRDRYIKVTEDNANDIIEVKSISGGRAVGAAAKRTTKPTS